MEVITNKALEQCSGTCREIIKGHVDGKKGGPFGVISFHHRGIALKEKVVDFIWVFCSVLVIEHREWLLTLSLTHTVPKWKNPLIYCRKVRNKRQQERNDC